jgi:YHS domain-containing protein
MKPLICRHCGCSLVRLGVSKDKATTYRHEGEEHYFCCQSCADRFTTDPRKSLQETKDLID